MFSFFRTLFFAVILGLMLAVPASYFFVKDFVQPRVNETLAKVEASNEILEKINTSLADQNEALAAQNKLLQDIIAKLNETR